MSPAPANGAPGGGSPLADLSAGVTLASANDGPGAASVRLAAAGEPAPALLDALFVVPHLGAGGTQRVVVLLLNHWAAAGWRIGLLTLFPTPDTYALHTSVLREDYARAQPDEAGAGVLRRANRRIERSLSRLSAVQASWKPMLGGPLLRGFRALRQGVVTAVTAASPRLAERFVRGKREVRWLRLRFRALRPRVIVSFLGATNIQAVLAAEGLGVPVLISERNDPAVQHLGQPWQRLRTLIYARADMVSANSAGALDTLAEWVPAGKLRRVHNPLAVPPRPEGVPVGEPRLVLVARLVEQKGVDLLLEAFARVAGALPDWQLDLVGDGPLRERLAERARSLDLVGRVHFHGHRQDPFPFLYRASVFVLPSRFEGMPNALLEALGAGLPAIVSDASPGPLELIRDGETGLVVATDDVDALAGAIRRLCTDAPLRARLAAAAVELAGRMALPVVAAQWEAVMAETVENYRGAQGDAQT
ncbi:glycosyltransferase [Thiohalocapsa sp. ML1]|uniref:glycosyltransferase n=1 Tax=Thiohalocapsa sp. ML1 TaxID=1431688 RepID=UPI0007323B01|nr:glycosyltransferase [Thiohalocapsa sp. ML1]